MAATGRLLRKAGVERLVCYDVGSRWGPWPPFSQLPLPLYRVGFEADSQEAQRLEQAGQFDIVVPAALSAQGGKRTLYLGHQSGCSSILGPDLRLIEQHCDPGDFVVVREIPLDTIPLHQAIRDFTLPPPDFIKLDVEGAEFEILSGAEDALAGCSGIFFEARLAQFYRGEALFGGVCTKLLERGFSVTSFESLGSFDGAIMLIDASVCRNFRHENRHQYLLKSAAFALVVGNYAYAVACLRKVATKKEILFG